MRVGLAALLMVWMTLARAAAADAVPVLGVTLDDSSGFDPGQGLTVSAVAAASTFDHLGVHVGDRLLTVNDAPMAKVADFATAAAALAVGDPVRLRVARGAETLTLAGTVEKLARPRELSQQTAQLADEVAQLRALAQQHPGGKLEQALMLLKQFEADLPKAAAEFKTEYPEGDFAISIHIDITSHRPAAAAATPGDPPAPPTKP